MDETLKALSNRVLKAVTTLVQYKGVTHQETIEALVEIEQECIEWREAITETLESIKEGGL